MQSESSRVQGGREFRADYLHPAEDERSFLIDHSLNFRATSFEGEPSFAWRDISYDDEDDDEDTEGSDFGEGGELFEFVTDSKTVSKATVREFEQTMLRCMYERVSAGSRWKPV